MEKYINRLVQEWRTHGKIIISVDYDSTIFPYPTIENKDDIDRTINLVQIAKEICERLKSKGFASTNIVLGIGSYTYQYNTRDTFGFAMKATYGEVNGVGREIFKDPITDDGTKKSKKGLLCVTQDDYNKIICYDCVSKEEEEKGLLKTIFKDSKLIKEVTLQEVRNKLS